MEPFRRFILVGAALTLAAGLRAAAEEPASAAPNVRSELMRLLRADAKTGAKADAAKPPAAKAAPAPAAPVGPAAPSGALGAPLSPDLWNYFTDTGILKSARGKKVTTELTFGPCTDGELLNQRYFW